MTTRLRIGLTVGDPAGIGPEIALKAAQDPRLAAACEPILYGPSSERDLRPYRPGELSAAAARAAHDAIVRVVCDAACRSARRHRNRTPK